MKIGLLTSHRAQKQFEKEYHKIIDVLSGKGHAVLHSMETKLEDLQQLSYAAREEVFLQFFKDLESCDLIIVENSLQSTHLGWGLGYLRDKGKPIVVLSLKDAPNDIRVPGEVFSNVDNMMAYEYTPETLSLVLGDALSYMSTHVDKRFTMILPADLYAKVEETSKKRKIPKAVFIRQLIEKEIQ